MLWGYIKLSGDRDIVVIAGNSNLATSLVLPETHDRKFLFGRNFPTRQCRLLQFLTCDFFFRPNSFQILKNGPTIFRFQVMETEDS